MKKYFFIVLIVSITNSYAQKMDRKTRDSLFTVLEQMGMDDQRYRWQLMLAEDDPIRLDSLKKLPDEIKWNRIIRVREGLIVLDKQKNDSIEALQVHLDSINLMKFKEIIEKFGYPSKERIGSNTSSYMSLHFTGEKEFKELFPVFQIELRRKNIPSVEFAAWYDRCQKEMGKKQLYGEWDKNFPCVEDLDVTNIERIKIGLGKLKNNKCQ